MIYNEDSGELSFYSESRWVAPAKSSKTIVLNRANNGNNNLIVNSTNTYTTSQLTSPMSSVIRVVFIKL